MRRRDFITLLSSVASWPLAARAQQKMMPVIGYLSSGSPRSAAPFLDIFRQGLNEAGYSETKNVNFEYRWAENDFDRLPALASELINHKVDIIVTGGGPAPALAAKNATSTIPILFTAVGDPIAAGLVTNLAHPGGNVTGFSVLVVDLNPKRLELLSELVPTARTIAILVNPNTASSERVIRDLQNAALALGIQLRVLKSSTETEIEAAFASLKSVQANALLIGADPIFFNWREQLVALASRYTIPAFYEWREFTAIGGLASYGPSLSHIIHDAGVYTGRIQSGEKPADLPVQQPTKFELVLNLKTAKALGLAIPQSLLARADEVIE